MRLADGSSRRLPLARDGCSYLRLEIAGVSSGATQFLLSAIVATLTELVSVISNEIQSDGILLNLLLECEAMRIEAYDDGRLVFRGDLRPHVDLTICFEACRLAAGGGIVHADGSPCDELLTSSSSSTLSLASPALPQGHGARFDLDGEWKGQPPGWIGGVELDPRSLIDAAWIEVVQ